MKSPILACLVFTLLISCKKEEAEITIDEQGLLTGKSWKPALTDKNALTNPSGSFIYYATLNCEKDDRIVFGTNNKMTVTRGTDKCNDAESAAETADYSVDFATKKFIIKGTTYTLGEISSNQLKYYAPLASSGNVVFLFEH